MRVQAYQRRVHPRPAGLCLGVLLLVSGVGFARDSIRQVLVRDIITISGVRDNQLVGYGIVVGLNGTGDRSQTQFTTQTLANAMRRMGVVITPATVRITNVAAVFVTASLPEFARPGMKLDVTVSSIGDAKSLEGGVLLLTALQGPDGQAYASAQGPLTVGGYSAGVGGNTKTVNHPNVGRVPEGAVVERDASIDLGRLSTISLMLREPDFTLACDVASAINQEFQREIARATDSRQIDINLRAAAADSVPGLIARVEALAVVYHPKARVILNERTGTIVMGGDVKLSPVSVIHGSLSIEITTTLNVTQPLPYSRGTTTTTPEVDLRAQEAPTRSIRLHEGADVEELITGLHAMGVSSREVVAILQAIKAAGGLAAELEVI